MKVSDIQEPKKPLDISPGMVRAAYNVLRQYCRNQGANCKKCILYDRKTEKSCSMLDDVPEDWPDLEVTDD